MQNLKSPLPKRKRKRLPDFYYGQNGSYFITICTKNRACLLGSIPVGMADRCHPQVCLTKIGKIAEKYVKSISSTYNQVTVDHYVIMPNHIHLLLTLSSEVGRQESACPTISNIVRAFKIMVGKEVKIPLFQASFYDHVIRNKEDYQTIITYIENNPLQWDLDRFYQKG